MQGLRIISALLLSVFAMPFMTADPIGSAPQRIETPRIMSQFVIPAPTEKNNRQLDNDQQKRLVIVDSDLANWGDDSMALCMLLRSPAVRVLGVTSTSGNVWTEQANVNILRFLQVIQHPAIAVHAGVSSELHAERLRYYEQVEKGSWARGSYAGALAHPLPPLIENPPGGPRNSSGSELSAVDFIIEQARRYRGQVTLLLFGPATNLAAALRKDPRLARNLGQVLMSGGALRVPGNTTKMAEFNFWFDPESANAVLRAGLPLTLLPLDATEGKSFDEEMTRFFEKGQSPIEKYLNQYFEQRSERRKGRPIPIWDEALAGVFLNPRIILSAKRESIRVVLDHSPHYGASRRSPAKRGRLQQVIYQVDTKALHNTIYQLFR